MEGASVLVEGLQKTYRSGSQQVLAALRDVNVEVPAGAMVAILGPSGAGKSTLLHLIGGMDRADAGRIRVGETDVTALPGRDEASYRRSIGFVFQRFHLIPAITALDNVVAPVLPYRTPFDKLGKGRRLLEAVGLADRIRALPGTLSSGQQQRVAIARALINDPGLVLADEPTGNLDSATGAQIIGLLARLREDRGMTVIIATHDLAVSVRCDGVIELRDGHVVDYRGVVAEPGRSRERDAGVSAGGSNSSVFPGQAGKQGRAPEPH